MEEARRRFGPDDAVRLDHVRQTGAQGTVTSPHRIPYGVVWSTAEIEERKATVEHEPGRRAALDRHAAPAPTTGQREEKDAAGLPDLEARAAAAPLVP